MMIFSISPAGRGMGVFTGVCVATTTGVEVTFREQAIKMKPSKRVKPRNLMVMRVDMG
jgi:hypothetical protein